MESRLNFCNLVEPGFTPWTYAKTFSVRFFIDTSTIQKNMARIFNIYFTYDNSVFHAMVSVRTTPFFTEYTLNNLDESIQELLPGNKILSTGSGAFNFQHISPDRNNELMTAVIRAVAEHLQTTEV